MIKKILCFETNSEEFFSYNTKGKKFPLVLTLPVLGFLIDTVLKAQRFNRLSLSK